MSPRIMSPHLDIAEADRQFIGEKVDRLRKFYDRIQEVTVILDTESHLNVAEILVYGPHLNIRVREQAADLRTAFETALNKTEVALCRHKEKGLTKRTRGRSVTIRRFHPDQEAPAATDADVAQPSPFEQLEPKPMSLDEARLQIKARGKGLLVFLNSQTSEVNILHRNSDDEVELVELSEAEALMAAGEEA